MIYRFGLYRAAARVHGVALDDLDDAAQEIAIAVWRAGYERPIILQRVAIDFARRHGRTTRRGHQRPEMLPLDAAKGVPTFMADPPTVIRSALLSAFRAMTERQRVALRRRLSGAPMTSLDSQHASAARRHVRRALAA